MAQGHDINFPPDLYSRYLFRAEINVLIVSIALFQDWCGSAVTRHSHNYFDVTNSKSHLDLRRMVFPPQLGNRDHRRFLQQDRFLFHGKPHTSR